MRTPLKIASTRKLKEYFDKWLGTKAESEQELVTLVEAGLPLATIQRLIDRGLSRQEVFSVVIHQRTLKHRRSRHEPLSREESERAIRTARLLARAQAVLGGQEAALNWMRSPKKRFAGKAPFDMISTEPGGRLVEEMLIQIDEGMFA